MSLNLETFLKGSKQYGTWLAISQNRIADALEMIPSKPSGKEWILFGLWKKKVAAGPLLDPARQVAGEILTGKRVTIESARWNNLTEAGEAFPEWMRLLCALQLNGYYPQQMKVLLKETLHWLEALVVEIKEKANGYPGNPIAGYVWMNGATIRTWCDPLVEIFARQENGRDRANALQLKCSITGAIMGHYPQTLGPDMIATAAALEAVGETAIPKGYYQAIISDFQPMADDIQTAPEEPVTEDDIDTLQALLDAYEGINRLEATDAFSTERAFLTTILARGVTAEEEEDDDEEE
jgi:hypothetical protein